VKKQKTWIKFDNGVVKGIQYLDRPFTLSINERSKHNNCYYGHYHYTKNKMHVSMKSKYIYVDDIDAAKELMLNGLTEFKEECKFKFIDNTHKGYYCLDCGKFSEKCIMAWGVKYVHPHGAESNEVWLVATHYDGCRGWD